MLRFSSTYFQAPFTKVSAFTQPELILLNLFSGTIHQGICLYPTSAFLLEGEVRNLNEKINIIKLNYEGKFKFFLICMKKYLIMHKNFLVNSRLCV
jgi:hypothetical protein